MKWDGKTIVAVIMACTVLLFIIFIAILSFYRGANTSGTETTKIWLAFMATIVTGLIAYLMSNENKKEE